MSNQASNRSWPFPEIVNFWTQQWQFRVVSVFPTLPCHFVAKVGLLDGTMAVFKAAPPGQEFTNAVEALHQMHGDAMVQVLRVELEQGVLLMECLQPGTTLSAQWIGNRDEDCTRTAALLMSRLRKPVVTPNSFPDVWKWGRSLWEWQRKTHLLQPISLAMLDKASSIYRELADSMSAKVLLHGDLHHENILQHGNAWCAIDPKGVVGEPAFEVGAFMYNPMPHIAREPALQKLLQRRLSIFAEVWNCEYERLWGWAFSQAVLSAIWSLEDGNDWQVSWHVAQRLSALRH